MSTLFLLKSLTVANGKRLLKQFPAIAAVTVLLLVFLFFSGSFIADHIYKEKSREPFGVAVYIPETEDLGYNELIMTMLQNTGTVKETMKLYQVSSLEEGNRMLSEKQVSYFIMIPEGFFHGLVSNELPPIEVAVQDKTSVLSYIANEVFMSYARYLSVDLAASYAVNEGAKILSLSDDERHSLLNTTDYAYLDRALAKDSYLEVLPATSEGAFSLKQHYTGVAFLLAVACAGFFLIPLLFAVRGGVSKKLAVSGVKRGLIFCSDSMVSFFAYLLLLLPGCLVIQIISRSFSIPKLALLLPTALILAVLTAVVTGISGSPFSAGLLYFVLIMLLLYIGGGVFPLALLPKAVTFLSGYLPGEALIRWCCTALFGGL